MALQDALLARFSKDRIPLMLANGSAIIDAEDAAPQHCSIEMTTSNRKIQ
jgi:hypothetical protein